MLAFPGKTLVRKEFINRIFLFRPDLQNNAALQSQIVPGAPRNAAVGFQTVRPAVKGAPAELTHMLTLSDARRVNAELIALVLDSAAGA